ncbi:MAG: hypothetical protein P4L22_06900 [Candidatus Babeliales bacterium]|nr:hypothetical protein [Candidatus Babeliales bacterium]
MFNKYKKNLIALLIFLACAIVLIICYPQSYYFNDKIEYKNFQVYYDKKIPNQIYAILDTVDQLIIKSECYSPELKFKIFLRSDENKYNSLPFQFPDKGTGWAIPIINNVFLYKSYIATNTTYTHLGHIRPLSTAIAHELVHVLVENKYFFKSKMAYFDNNSLSRFGLLWKEEGYSEYISDGPSMKLDEGMQILNNQTLLEEKYVPHVEYFKYWLAVRYLIENKHMTFKEILDANIKLDNVLCEAMQTKAA